jgi:aminopeptidase YwaD
MDRRKLGCLTIIVTAVLSLTARGLAAQRPPLLPEKEVAALADELRGETAKRNLEGLTRFHRQRGSRGFHDAAEMIADRAQSYGLSDAKILEFPADGKVFYGTQLSRPPWDAEKAELWDVTDAKDASAESRGQKKLADYTENPIVLAEDSESADITAGLVDIGTGMKETDYAGKSVKGHIVLVSAQPGAVQDLAIAKFGAVGIVSYAQNQKTAWWGEDENLIRWGHLETFSPNKTFAFMVSLKRARGLQERLARGEQIKLYASVKAGQHSGNYEVVTATIPGADPKLKDEEIAFSCHLDHQQPGANDNASGCVTILEVARTLQKLINDGKLARPARTIRFIWPPEIEGTLALLNAKPDFAKRIKFVIHMDMVGGGPETKAVFHVTHGPMSLPSFVHDVAWNFAQFVNEQSYRFAATGSAEYPLVAPEAGKEPLRAEYSPYSMGSDHDVYQDSSFAIPAIYLNDWPDRYIHTNFDSPANIDATKLKRAAFIGAASGYFLANPGQQPWLGTVLLQEHELRKSESQPWMWTLPREEACIYYQTQVAYSNSIVDSAKLFAGRGFTELISEPPVQCGRPPGRNWERAVIYQRKPEPKGPLAVFAYDYFADHAKAAGLAKPRLLSYQGLRGSGEEYAYEVLNFANGKRNAQQIRDALSAEYGPVPFELVSEYLQDLEKIGIVARIQ